MGALRKAQARTHEALISKNKSGNDTFTTKEENYCKEAELSINSKLTSGLISSSDSCRFL
jgi:hypothetical protein